MVATAFVSAGCGGGGDAARVALVRDSAGIRIVESPEPGWSAPGGWVIEPEPKLSIGVADGDSMAQFFGITSAVRLTDGTIVVADRGMPSVRWYGSDGAYLRGTGRTGGGPGEFSRIGPGSMCVLDRGDVVVGDPMQQRAHVFSQAGSVAAVIPAPTVGAALPSFQGCFADGTFLLWHAEQPSDRVPDTWIEAEFVWTRIGGDGAIQNELSRVRQRTQYLLGDGGGGGTYHSRPFTVRPSSVAGGDRFFVTSGASPEIEVRRTDGTLAEIWRWTPSERTRSADVIGRYASYIVDAQRRPEQRSQWSKFFGMDVELPEYIAATAGLSMSADGQLWAERYRLPWDSVVAWDVFDRAGAWQGGVEMPRGVSVLQIHEDAILGRHTDEDGVERIVLHRLRRK